MNRAITPHEKENTPNSSVAKLERKIHRIPNVWGWAIWKRSWKHYNFDITDWKKELPKSEIQKYLGHSRFALVSWSKVFDLIAAGKIDTWDYQLVLSQWRQDALAVVPNVNLTDNVGFSKDATHTTSRPGYLIESQNMIFPMSHPELLRATKADAWTVDKVHGANAVSFIRSSIRYGSRVIRSSFNLMYSSVSSSR